MQSSPRIASGCDAFALPHRRPLCIAVVSAFALAATGCASIMPWQRQHLAAPVMTGDGAEPHRALMIHAHASREGFADSSATQGASCGCY